MQGNQIRKIVLEQSYKHHIGHIGSCLSVADIVAEIYNIKQPDDVFILSKGHAGLAQYAAMSLVGEINIDEFMVEYGVHQYRNEKIPFMTGSLGMGLSYGVGVALAKRIKKEKGRVFVLISDAECNTGIVWEALFFLSQFECSNLSIIIDNNKQQAFGYNVLNQDMFGLCMAINNVYDLNAIDGHDPIEIKETIYNKITIANTTFGYPISFMKNEIKWHYLPMTEEQYKQAMSEVE